MRIRNMNYQPNCCFHSISMTICLNISSISNHSSISRSTSSDL